MQFVFRDGCVGSIITWWMQLLLSRHVESGSEQSRLPVIRAVRCFSSSWLTMASTVSVVWQTQRLRVKYSSLWALTEISSSLFKSGSSSLKTEKNIYSEMRGNCCVNILYLRYCSCKNKVSLCRFSNDSMVAFKPIEANINNDFISFIFNTPGAMWWCKSILRLFTLIPTLACTHLSIIRQVIFFEYYCILLEGSFWKNDFFFH